MPGLCFVALLASLTEDQQYGLKNTIQQILKRAKIEGFIILDYMDRALEGTLRINDLVESGDIVLQMDEQEGFDNIPNTLLRLFQGANTGKQVLKVSDPPVPANTSVLERAVLKILSTFYSWKG